MFSDFKNEKHYVKRTVEAFEKKVGLKMQDPKPHGGYGNFRLPESAYSGRHPLVGEYAGFQDTLWGFGMRLAISSGILAAESLLCGKDYDRLWKKELQLPHQLNNSSFERARRGEMCVKKSEGLPVGNSKIFSCADCLVSLSPKGEVLSPILGVRFS